MLELLLWISGIILSIILTIILTDPINFAIANVFGEVKVKENDISGIWKATWWQEKENKKYSTIQYYRVRRFGNYLVAHSINDEVNPTEIKAKIKNNTFITGTWAGRLMKNQGRYHGALQFLIYPTGNKIAGKWIGFDKNHKIREGDWEWIFVKSKMDKKELEQLRSEETIDEI